VRELYLAHTESPNELDGLICIIPPHESKAMGMQLMRRGQISTTMSVYGNALREAKWEANEAVVSKLLRKA